MARARSVRSGRFALRVEGARTRLELSSQMGEPWHRFPSTTGRRRRQRRVMAGAIGRGADRAGVFGWRVPLGQLPDWLEGRIAEPTKRSGGDAVAGREHGWSIRIDAREAGRPRRLSLDWPASPATGERRLSLRLVVDSALRIVTRP